jgi:hypothetical protein
LNAARTGVAKRWTKVDPYATSDIARENRLTGVETAVLQQLAIRAEYRSSEWTGTLGDLASATRFSPKAVAKAVAGLLAKGRLEEIHPFRQGTEGRVLVLEHARMVNLARRPNIGPICQTTVARGQDKNETTIRPPDEGFCTIDRIEQAKQGVREVQRQRGAGLSDDGLCCVCGEAIAGHPFSDHEPESSIIAAHLPESAEEGGLEWEVRREVMRP